MINSNNRKLCLSGWLMEHGAVVYNSPLKLQKFLLMYEAFSKIAGEEADFSNLKGYKRGPVFSTVFGDYTHDRIEFDFVAKEAYSSGAIKINEDRAALCHFIVGTLSEEELSELTHKLRLWNSHRERIMRGEQQVSLCEDDFDQNDANMVNLLGCMYPLDMVRNSSIVSIDKHYFVFSNDDISRLTEQHFDVLDQLIHVEELHNPVYVEIDDEGRLLVD